MAEKRKPASAPAGKDPRHSLGRAGEEMAAQVLRSAGLEIVARNWRCSAGEIDIVARDQGPDFATGEACVPWLVVVEVRTKRGDQHGTAAQSITPRKQAKLRTVARTYVKSIGWRGPWRIDVVAIQMDSSGKLLSINHIRHAVHDS